MPPSIGMSAPSWVRTQRTRTLQCAPSQTPGEPGKWHTGHGASGGLAYDEPHVSQPSSVTSLLNRSITASSPLRPGHETSPAPIPLVGQRFHVGGELRVYPGGTAMSTP